MKSPSFNGPLSYTPVFNAECDRCGGSPCVGIHAGVGIALTNFCGPCFFADRAMSDYELWNDEQEPSE